MFSRAAVQSAVDERASLAHKASVPSPHGFELRPAGFSDTEPNYRIVVERVAFRLRAALVPDYLAVSIVAAIVSGGRHVPGRVERLRTDLAELGWSPDINLSEAFRLQATKDDVLGVDESDLVDAAITVALLISDFALDQLIVTRPIGEMRPAVERSVGDDETHAIWLYDPSERDRATQVHRSLENWLIIQLRAAGVEALDPVGAPFFDVAWRIGDRLYVCEVKSTSNNEAHQLRLGLGQIIQYRHLLASVGGRVDVQGCLLIENQPADAHWMDICRAERIVLFWPARWDSMSELLGNGDHKGGS
jgi:hypothetical protein